MIVIVILLKVLCLFDLLLKEFTVLIEALLNQKLGEIRLELRIGSKEWLNYHIDVAKLIFEGITSCSIIEGSYGEVQLPL